MPIIHHDSTGQSLYARFDDGSNTAVDLTEGSSLNVGKYTAADSAIVTAGLAAGTYTGRIFGGTAGAQANTDYQVGSFSGFVFDGTNEVADTPQTGDSYALAAGADGFAATKAAVDATKAVTDALSPRLPGSGTLATGADVAAVSVSPTPVSQVPVPIVRTWRIKATSTGLIGEETRVLRVGDTRLFAADFLKDLPTNGRLIDCAFAIDDGTAGGITFASTATDPGVDKTQAKVSITGVTAGDYEIAVTATYQDADGGGTSTALVALKVVE